MSLHIRDEQDMGKHQGISEGEQCRGQYHRVNHVDQERRQHYVVSQGKQDRSLNCYDILFLHDSICHDIHVYTNRLISESNRTGQKKVTYTIEETHSFLTKSVKQSKTIFLHIEINNLKYQSAQDASNNFLSLLAKCQNKL